MVIHSGTNSGSLNRYTQGSLTTSMLIHTGTNRWITDYKYADTPRD